MENSSGPLRAPGPRWAGVAVFLACLALAAWLRLRLVGFGLPFVYHPDEPTNLNVISMMVRNTDANPHFFNYPSLFLYLNVPGQALVQSLHGALPPIAMQSMANGIAPVPDAFVAARLTTLAFGLGILPVLWLWGRREGLSTVTLGIIGLLFALSPLLLLHSTYATPDVFAAFFTAAALSLTGRIVAEGRSRDIAFAAVAAGLAASAKYNAGFALAAVALAVLLHGRGWRGVMRGWLIAGVAAAIAFALTSPFVFLDPLSAWRDISSELRHYRHGHPGSQGLALIPNLGVLASEFGPLLLMVPLSVLPRSPNVRLNLPALAYVVGYFGLVSAQKVFAERNLLPLFPPILFLAGSGCDAVARWLSIRRGPRWLAPIAAMALFAGQAAATMRNQIEYRADPRSEARDWLDGVLPRDGSTVLIESYVPYVQPQGRDVRSLWLILGASPADRASADWLVFSQEGSGRFLRNGDRAMATDMATLRAAACGYRQFPEDSAQPDIWVLQMRCAAKANGA